MASPDGAYFLWCIQAPIQIMTPSVRGEVNGGCKGGCDSAYSTAGQPAAEIVAQIVNETQTIATAINNL